MAPPALLRAAAAELRRRARRSPVPLQALLSPPHQAPSSRCTDPCSDALRRHLITLRGYPHPRSASDLLRGRPLLPTSFSPFSTTSSSSSSSSDGPPDKPLPPKLSWVHRWLPEAARPYAMLARLDKPIGTWLLAWPCMWYMPP
jgi:4-hydroxybenzoate polyprenyltransferase